MPRPVSLLLLLLVACNGDGLESADRQAELPGTDADIRSIAADAPEEELVAAIEQALRTPGKSADNWRFVVLRAMDRHERALPDSAMHVMIGAGVELPLGSMRIRRLWQTSGQIDGTNEQLETWGIAVAVERGAAQPFAPEVVAAARRLVAVVAPRIALHPDCVVSMGEVPFTRDDPTDGAERELAAAVRGVVAVPPAPGQLTIHSAEGPVVVRFERRDTNTGRMTGMMMRKGFDGTDRGMLFVYPHRAQRRFYMRNCFIPIDLAYLRKGRVEQIVTMPPQPGIPTADLPGYESNAAVRYALEMPGGWFAEKGIAVGDRVDGLSER